ncbi:MAG: hypothetical protein M3396_11345, partial [Actinomycetota bacterium]|nr:hypothetical protein [Actinomycetota bacterium]
MQDARHLPLGRSQAGDRYLNFYAGRDNLRPKDGEGYMWIRARAVMVCVVLVFAAAGGANAQEASTSARRLRVAIHSYENNLTPFTLTLTTFPVTADMVMLVYDSLFWSQA